MKKHTSLGVEENFFAKPLPSSRIKLQIITEYFEAYMNKLARANVVGYADLFAGPGVYDDGSDSIPMVICKKVTADERLRRFVRLWFNEADPQLYARLQANVAAVEGITSLSYAPAITPTVVSKKLAPSLARKKTPTLFFADPCGYKGLSLRLITAALARPMTDCVFFFNYSRINMKLGYPVMDESINEFFETDRAEALRARVRVLKPDQREDAVLGTIEAALKDVGAFPLSFRFKTRYHGGTSHHLIYASKNAAALAMMKRIMNKASSDIVDGVGSCHFDPRDAHANLSLFAGLFEVQQRLLEALAGQTLTFAQLIQREAAETKYTETNYRDALLDLETEGCVSVDPPLEARPFQAGHTKRTLAATSRITFPE